MSSPDCLPHADIKTPKWLEGLIAIAVDCCGTDCQVGVKARCVPDGSGGWDVRICPADGKDGAQAAAFSVAVSDFIDLVEETMTASIFFRAGQLGQPHLDVVMQREDGDVMFTFAAESL